MHPIPTLLGKACNDSHKLCVSFLYTLCSLDNWSSGSTINQPQLIYWGWYKMAVILQNTFSNTFSWLTIFVFQLKFHINLFPCVQLKVGLHWLQKRLGTEQVTRHYMNEFWPGGWFNIKITPHRHRKSHCGDKMILQPSYLHNGISYTGKTTYLYWIRILVHWCICVTQPWWVN